MSSYHRESPPPRDRYEGKPSSASYGEDPEVSPVSGLTYIISAAEIAEDIRRSFAKNPRSSSHRPMSKDKDHVVDMVRDDRDDQADMSARYKSLQYRPERGGHYRGYSSGSLRAQPTNPRRMHRNYPPHHSYHHSYPPMVTPRKEDTSRFPLESRDPYDDIGRKRSVDRARHEFPEAKRHRSSSSSGSATSSSTSTPWMPVLKWTKQQGHDWDERYEQLCEFNKEFGHTRVPRMGYNRGKYRGLGRWVERQRANYIEKSPVLTQEQIAQLDDIDFVWILCPRVDWDERFDQVVAFKEENGHTRIPRYYKKDEGLGRWVDRQRNMYNSGKLSPERIKKLESLGFSFSPHMEYFETRLKELIEYKKQNGHVNVPRNYKNKELANWVCNARYRKLTPEQTTKLEALGFRWAKARAWA